MTAAEGRAERAVREKLGQHRSGFRSLLLPQERLLAQTDFRRASGKNRLETPPDTRSTARKVAETSAGAVLEAVFMPDPPSLKRMLGGISVAGHFESWAFRLMEASRSLGTNRGKYLLVTNRRLLLASSKIFGKEPDYAVALEVPRDALADARVEGRPFTRGRAVIRFTDGSMIALDLGTYRTTAARSLVQALTGPGTAAAPPA